MCTVGTILRRCTHLRKFDKQFNEILVTLHCDTPRHLYRQFCDLSDSVGAIFNTLSAIIEADAGTGPMASFPIYEKWLSDEATPARVQAWLTHIENAETTMVGIADSIFDNIANYSVLSVDMLPEIRIMVAEFLDGIRKSSTLDA